MSLERMRRLIGRFREQITDRGLMALLLAELGRQLEGRGVLLKEGTLIDATIVRSAARRFVPCVLPDSV